MIEGYASEPLELEFDSSRGVLYLTGSLDPEKGITRLRVCQVPTEKRQQFGRQTITLDLDNIKGNPRHTRGRVYKKYPVFVETEPDKIEIVDEAGAVLFEILNVPEYLTESLNKGKYTDITCGYTR